MSTLPTLPKLNFQILPDRLAITQYASPLGIAPLMKDAERFLSITIAPDETTVVGPEKLIVHEHMQAIETGWRALKVEGPIPFTAVGILAHISQLLAAESISIFAISTYNTDYVLVKEAKLKAATKALVAAGHIVLEYA